MIGVPFCGGPWRFIYEKDVGFPEEFVKDATKALCFRERRLERRGFSSGIRERRYKSLVFSWKTFRKTWVFLRNSWKTLRNLKEFVFHSPPLLF